MHVFCGIDAPGQEEGFGQKRVCTECNAIAISSSFFSSDICSVITPPTATTTSTLADSNNSIFEINRTTIDEKKTSNRLDTEECWNHQLQHAKVSNISSLLDEDDSSSDDIDGDDDNHELR